VVLDPQRSFTAKLRAAPVAAHTAVARSCVQQTPSGASVTIVFGAEQPPLSNGVAAHALAQAAFAALQALPQQPQVTLRLYGEESDAFDRTLAAAERFADLAGDTAVAGVELATRQLSEASAAWVRATLRHAGALQQRTRALLRRLGGGLRSLHAAAVSHCSECLCNDPERALFLRHVLPGNKVLLALRHLRICGCELTKLGARDSQTYDFAAELAQLTGLTHLELRDNTMGGGLRALLQAAVQLPELADAALCNNAGTPAYLPEQHHEAVHSAMTRLRLQRHERDSRFAWQRLGPLGAIASYVARTTALRQLSLANLQHGVASMPLLARALQKLPSLHDLEQKTRVM
jgi:hypothetical protein